MVIYSFNLFFSVHIITLLNDYTTFPIGFQGVSGQVYYAYLFKESADAPLY